MLSRQITTVLFDLDGTLLPMDLEEFTKTYFFQLSQKAAPYGYDPKALVAAVWKGTKAMVENDGTRSNEDRFWTCFQKEMGDKAGELKPDFDEFYRKDFHRVKSATGENPLAKQAVHGLREKGYTVVLATNPLFPASGVETRLSWIGLSLKDFSYVSTYENSTFCKPNPDYFREILRKIGKTPEECFMVGNDAAEDLAALKAGIQTYLITDCLIEKEGCDLTHIPKGSFSEFMAHAGLEGGAQ